MTLTLQDAQHVSWKIFLKINNRVGVESGEGQNASAVMSDLLKQAQDAATVVENLEGLKPSEENTAQRMLAEKLNSILYCAFVVAERYRLDLEESFLEQANDKLLSLLT